MQDKRFGIINLLIVNSCKNRIYFFLFFKDGFFFFILYGLNGNIFSVFDKKFYNILWFFEDENGCYNMGYEKKFGYKNQIDVVIEFFKIEIIENKFRGMTKIIIWVLQLKIQI